jgi:hypothetical protein
MSMTLAMDSDQVATFETFFITTLKGGALTFDWVHPRTGAAKTFQFQGIPTYVTLGGDDWRISFVLEMLP